MKLPELPKQGTAGGGRNASISWIMLGLLVLSGAVVLLQFAPQLRAILIHSVAPAVVFTEEGFYYLTIARNMGSGLGFTADGSSVTTGFQPLWAILVSVPYAVANVAGGDGLVYVLMLMLVILTASLLLAGFAANAISRAPSLLLFVLALAVFASDIRWLMASLSGLETTLYMAFLLGLLILWARSPLLAAGESFSSWDRNWSILFGVVLGLTFLTRIDSVFFGAAYLAAMLVVTGFAWRGVRAAAISGGISAVFLLAWLSYPFITQGAFIPQSGTATIGGIYPSPGVSYNARAALQVIDSSPLTTLGFLLKPLGLQGWPTAILGILALAAILFLAYRRRCQTRLSLLVPHAVGMMLVFAFYIHSSHAPWRFHSYFMPVHLLVLLLLSLVTYSLVLQLSQWRRRALLPVAGIMMLGVFILHGGIWAKNSLPQGDNTTPAVLWLADHPPDSRVYMFQSGRTGYAFPERVVNLDGKTNFAALTALQDHRLAAYLLEINARVVFDEEDFPPRIREREPQWEQVFEDISDFAQIPEGWFMAAPRRDPRVSPHREW